MKLNKKSFQNFFKLFSYGFLKLYTGKIEGIIDPNKSNEIEVKFIRKKTMQVITFIKSQTEDFILIE
jgi:hypothetical protein